MLSIKKKYIIDENRKKVAVQLDMATFKQIEELLEDHAFAKIMKNNKKSNGLSLQEAEKYYRKLKKKKWLKILYDKKFLKDLSKIPSKIRIKIEKFAFKEIHSYNNISEIVKAQRLKGYEFHYKIRFGDYRVGIYYEKNYLNLKG